MPIRRRLRTLALCAVVAVSAPLALGGCALSGSERANADEATLLLDGDANAVHAGAYLALARDFDGAEGVDLDVEVPEGRLGGTGPLVDGRADFAIVPINALIGARAQGHDVVGVMALVQRPLTAVLAQPSVRRPRDLEGRRAGLAEREAGGDVAADRTARSTSEREAGGDGTAARTARSTSERAVLDTVVRGDGADPERVRHVAVGRDPLPALLRRRVDAVAGALHTEGVEAREQRPGVRVFRADEFGAPSYPELVLATARTTIQDDPGLVRAVVATLRRGYRELLGDPEAGISAMRQELPDADAAQLQRQLDAVSPAFTHGAGVLGELDPARLRAWAAWTVEAGIAPKRPDVAQMFAPRFSTAGQIE